MFDFQTSQNISNEQCEISNTGTCSSQEKITVPCPECEKLKKEKKKIQRQLRRSETKLSFNQKVWAQTFDVTGAELHVPIVSVGKKL